MSYTMTLEMPERATAFVKRRGARFNEELNAIVLAFVTTQMRYEMSEPKEFPGNGRQVLEALRACPVDVDFDRLIPRRTDVGRAHSIDFGSLLKEDA